LMKKVMSESTYDNKLRPGYYENNYANMAAAFIVETERWNLATELFPENKPATTSEQAMGSHGSHNASGNAPATLRTSSASMTLPLFIRGLAAAMSGSATAEQSIAGLQAIRASRGSTSIEIMELEIAALSASMKKDHAKAIELMKKATALEASMTPPYGPPGLIKPSHELFGEILLRAEKRAEAAEQFKVALQRQPNRARSLLGATRSNETLSTQKAQKTQN
jgi:hypothetical protein